MPTIRISQLHSYEAVRSLLVCGMGRFPPPISKSRRGYYHGDFCSQTVEFFSSCLLFNRHSAPKYSLYGANSTPLALIELEKQKTWLSIPTHLSFSENFSWALQRIYGFGRPRFSRSGYPRMALHFSTDQTPTSRDRRDDQILIEKTKTTRTVVLNRPLQLNAISYWMTGLLKEFYQQWEDDNDIQMILIKGSGRAFSAGGDVAEVYHFGSKGLHDKSIHFFSLEYNVVYTIGTYKKPHVALLDGIVMGGGAGLSLNGSFRVVSEKTVFAMPETGLGLHPDVGASYFLSRLPGFLGEYVGLTGARLDGTELLAVGLATHYVPSERLLQLEEKLKSLGSGTPSLVSQAIDSFSEKMEFKKGSLLHRLSEIDVCFSKSSVEEILGALERHQEETDDDWYTSIITTLRKASPLSLKLTLRSIREGRHQTLYKCLMREYRMTVRCLLRNISNDFYEGCRAILVDKDKNPKWNPSSLESVTPAMVDHYFSPFEEPADELQLPGQHRQQTAIYEAHSRL